VRSAGGSHERPENQRAKCSQRPGLQVAFVEHKLKGTYSRHGEPPQLALCLSAEQQKNGLGSWVGTSWREAQA
jgi:hypothetical protein